MNANTLIGIAGTPSVSPRASLVSCCLPASEGLGFAGHGRGLLRDVTSVTVACLNSGGASAVCRSISLEAAWPLAAGILSA